MTTLTNSLTQLCKELHPEAETGSDAVLAYQKDLQRVINFKNRFNVPATEDIQLWFDLFETWNELKAQELNPEPRNNPPKADGAGLNQNNGGQNVSDNNIGNNNFGNRLVLVGDQTCGDLSGIV